MQVTETASQGLKRSLHVVVPADEIKAKCTERLTEIASTTSLPGFRKGKIPPKVAEKRFGSSVRGEILEKTVENSLRSALEQLALRPAVQPAIDFVCVEEDKDLEFKIELEVLPEITPIDFSELTIEQFEVEISEEELNDALGNLAEKHKISEPVTEDRACKKGDIAVIDFRGEVEGKANDALNGEAINLELGSNMFIPGFEDQLSGMKSGESKTIEITFPEDYGSTEMAGKDAKFEVFIKELRSLELPDIDDSFAEKLGQKNLEALRERIREQLVSQHNETAHAIVKRKLLDVLDQQHHFDLPEVMVEQEFNNIWEKISANKEAGNLEPEDVGKSEEELKEEYRSIAERRVKLGLLLSYVGDQNQIGISDQDMTAALVRQARQYPGQEEQVFKFFRSNRNAQMSLRAPIIEDKVVDLIISQAKTETRNLTARELEDLVREIEKSSELQAHPD